MRKRLFKFSLFAGTMVAAVASSGRAAVVVDGSLGAGEYGTSGALATQTVNTQFGDNSDGSGASSNGSELDAAYGIVSGGNLNLFFAGNYQNNGNHLNIFLADGRAGQFTLTGTGSPLNPMNGSKFSPNFGNGATLAIDANDSSNTVYVDEFDLIGNTQAFLGADPLTGGVGSGLSGGTSLGVQVGVNNTNTAGVVGGNGAANAAAADAVGTGFEISIPLSLLGYAPTANTGSIEVLADINGGGNNYLSNQFLPGLPAGTNNLGPATTFDFSGSSGNFFTVAVPEPASFGLLGGAAMMLLNRRRRKA